MNQSVKKRILDMLIVIAAIILGFVIIYPQYRMNQPTKVKIAVDRSVASLPIYVAQNEGFFETQKVIPDLVTISDPYERNQALIGGECAFTLVPWSIVLDSEYPYRVIASAESRQLKPAESFLAVRRRIKRIKDLRRKKIGLFSEMEHLFDEISDKLKQYKIYGMEKVFIEPDEISDVIKNRTVDALFLSEPHRSLAIDKGTKIILDGPLSGYVTTHYPFTAFCFTEDYKEKDKIGAARIKNAIEASIRHITRNPGEAKQLLYDAFNIEGELYNTELVEFQRLQEINREAVKSYRDLFEFRQHPDSVIAGALEFER